MTEPLLKTERYRCYICGKWTPTEKHHIFGSANRKHSERLGLYVYLCHDCHTGAENCAQYNSDTNKYLKQEAQVAYEKTHSHEQWMLLIRKNYI